MCRKAFGEGFTTSVAVRNTASQIMSSKFISCGQSAWILPKRFLSQIGLHCVISTAIGLQIPIRLMITCTSVTIKEYFAQLSQHVPGYYKLAKVIPSGLIKKAGMIKMAYKEKYGTQTWIKNNITPRVTAYYGSHENWKKIGSWKEFKVETPSMEPSFLDHGYDETKPEASLDLEDMIRFGRRSSAAGNACRIQWSRAISSHR